MQKWGKREKEKVYLRTFIKKIIPKYALKMHVHQIEIMKKKKVHSNILHLIFYTLYSNMTLLAWRILSLWATVKNLSLDKSLRSHGFTAGRFYKTCWKIFKEDGMLAPSTIH